MLVGVVAAFRSEIAALLGLMESVSREQVNGIKCWRGGVGQHDVVTVVCGAGPERSAESLVRASGMLDKADLIIDIGVCGALDTEVPLGSLVAMSSVAAVYHAHRRPLSLSQLEFTEEKIIEQGKLITHRVPVFDSRVADRLALRFDVGFVDMEAWEVAMFCHENSIPVAVVKCVSDHADESSSEGYSTRVRQCADKCAKFLYFTLSCI